MQPLNRIRLIRRAHPVQRLLNPTPSTVEFTLPTKPYPHIVLVTPDESGSSEASPSTTDTGMPVKGSTQYVLNHQVYVREGPGKEYPIAGFGLRGMSCVFLSRARSGR